MRFLLLYFYCFLLLSSLVITGNHSQSTNQSLHVYVVSTFHRSYWLPQIAVARELALRGHHVTIQWPQEYQNTTQLPTTLDFPHETLYRPIGPPSGIEEMYATLTNHSVFSFWNTLPLSREVYASTRSHGWVNTLHHIIEETREHPVDLLLSDNSPAIQGACEILFRTHGAHCVMTTPFYLRNPESEFFLVGPNVLPPWMPLTSVGHRLATSWIERVMDQILNRVIRWSHSYLTTQSNKEVAAFMRDHWPEHTPDLNRIYPTLVNSFEGWDWNIPLPPHMRHIGPIHYESMAQKIAEAKQQYLACRAQQTCSELDRFLDENDSVVVVSFGKSVELRLEHVHAVLGLARTLESVRVLWTLRERHLDLLPPPLERPSNLRIATWVDLVRVMAHPHVRGLVAQCGAATAMEAMITTTPLLCVPFLYDQYDISVLIEHHQLGLVLPQSALIEPYALTNIVRELLRKGSSFNENAARLQRMAASPVREMRETIDWVELVAREGGDWMMNSPAPTYCEYHELFYFLMIVFGCSLAILTTGRCGIGNAFFR